MDRIALKKDTLFINAKPALDYLEDCFQIAAKCNATWPYKNQVVINFQELKNSLLESGKYAIFDSKGTLELGHSSPKDVGLEPVEVQHKGDTVEWLLAVPLDSNLVHKSTQVNKLVFYKNEYLSILNY